MAVPTVAVAPAAGQEHEWHAVCRKECGRGREETCAEGSRVVLEHVQAAAAATATLETVCRRRIRQCGRRLEPSRVQVGKQS
eukprot:5186882-Pleurochrysis_carterae.AAC.1